MSRRLRAIWAIAWKDISVWLRQPAVAETDLRTQDVSLIQFEIIPNLILLLTMAGILNCGMATAREFEDLTIKELLLAPIASSTVIAGKLLAGWLTTLVLSLIVLVI